MRPRLLSSVAVGVVSLCVSCAPVEEDEAPDSGEVDVAVDAGADVVEQDVAPEEPRAAWNEPCVEHIDCERGLVCDERACASIVGCGLFGNPPNIVDAGCIANWRGGQSSAKECDTDAECDGSPHGAYCTNNVCNVYIPCAEQSDCDALDGRHECRGNVCLPCDVEGANCQE